MEEEDADGIEFNTVDSDGELDLCVLGLGTVHGRCCVCVCVAFGFCCVLCLFV